MLKLRSIIVLSFVILIAFSQNTAIYAQRFEGKIVLSNTYENIPPEIAGMESMLPKQTVQYLKGHKSRVEVDLMGGSQVVISDAKSDHGLILIDTHIFSWAIKVGPEDKEKYNTEEKPEAIYLDEYQDILGYKCQKVEIKKTLPNGSIATQIIYVSKEIQSVHQAYDFIEGFPLAYDTVQNGMTVKVRASKIEKIPVDDRVFEMIIPENFEEKTMDDLMEMQGRK